MSDFFNSLVVWMLSDPGQALFFFFIGLAILSTLYVLRLILQPQKSATEMPFVTTTPGRFLWKWVLGEKRYRPASSFLDFFLSLILIFVFISAAFSLKDLPPEAFYQ